MGSKSQRQNQHMRHLMAKIRKFEKCGKNTDGLKRELAYVAGDEKRPSFKTGRDTDPRLKKLHRA